MSTWFEERNAETSGINVVEGLNSTWCSSSKSNAARAAVFRILEEYEKNG